MTTNKTKRLLFLFSHTGGGHRSVASAVGDVLQQRYGEQVQIQFLDPLSTYAPWPFNQSSTLYPPLTRMQGLPWAIIYHSTDGQRRVRLIASIIWPIVRKATCRLLRENPADVIVAYHPFFTHFFLKAMAFSGDHIPLVALVTDLTTAHTFWFAPGETRCIVPTEPLYRRALACGLPPERVHVTGLPVHPRFVEIAQEDPIDARQRLGLATGLPVILLVSGAEGMGATYQQCRAIAGSGIDAQLVVIAGRNARLQEKLSAETWPIPVRVEGFVDNMHEWMRAADLLVTKAGPTTICEAFVMGLPMVLSGALPGQEPPNVDYVVRSGAGIWASTSKQVAAVVHDVLSPGSPRLAQMAARARAVAQPDAVQRAAEIVWRVMGEEGA